MGGTCTRVGNWRGEGAALGAPRLPSASTPVAPALRPVSAPPAASAAARRALARKRHHRASRAVYRRRRVLLALVLLNVAELCGVTLVSPGFWIGEAVSGALLGAYLVPLPT